MPCPPTESTKMIGHNSPIVAAAPNNSNLIGSWWRENNHMVQHFARKLLKELVCFLCWTGQRVHYCYNFVITIYCKNGSHGKWSKPECRSDDQGRAGGKMPKIIPGFFGRVSNAMFLIVLPYHESYTMGNS